MHRLLGGMVTRFVVVAFFAVALVAAFVGVTPAVGAVLLVGPALVGFVAAGRLLGLLETVSLPHFLVAGTFGLLTLLALLGGVATGASGARVLLVVAGFLLDVMAILAVVASVRAGTAGAGDRDVLPAVLH